MGMADFVGHPKTSSRSKTMKKMITSIATLFAMVFLAACSPAKPGGEIPIHQEYFGLYLDYGQSAYYDDDQGKYVRTEESCPYRMTDDGVLDVTVMGELSPLKKHITRVHDRDDGDQIISCGEEGLMEYSDANGVYKIVLFKETENDLWAFWFINPDNHPEVVETMHEEDTVLYSR